LAAAELQVVNVELIGQQRRTGLLRSATSRGPAMLRIVMIGLGLLPAIVVASAQDWPQRPVRLVVPYPAGGATDIVARPLAQKLGDALGQRFFVENKAGANGMIGAQAVAKGDADGTTFLVASSAEIALNQNLYKDMHYDPVNDLTPISLLAWTPLVLVAHPSLAASNLVDLVKLARAEPVDFASPGVGSAHHLTGEYINKLHSTRLVHVPYRGAAPAVTDLVGGQVKLMVAGLPPVAQFLRAGTLKPIAVASGRRSPTFPDIPAMAETAGFEDFDFTNWFGLLARTGTPQSILDRLGKVAVAAVNDAYMRDILMTQAAEPVGNTSAEFRDFIRAESAKYAKIVEFTGIKAQ
jgi:tripartite-type tricarboxylate transporter receptor subunit TctC